MMRSDIMKITRNTKRSTSRKPTIACSKKRVVKSTNRKVKSACGKKSVKASNSGTYHRRRIVASASSYDSNMQKIQYYAKKVVADISMAADIFAKAREGWAPIEIPDVPGDDLFYEWYVTDYIDSFDDSHSKDEEIYELRGRNVEYAVKYGYFDSKDLGNYGDDEDALYDFLQSLNYMEDIYYVTTEFGHTIADLAADPYAVFDDVFGDDESDKLYYSEEVLAEFDLLTSSDRVYDFAKDAQGIVNLYNEVSDYFSYSNAEQLLSEYESGYEDENVNSSCRGKKSVKASRRTVCASSFRTDFQKFLGDVDREVSDALYQYDDAMWEVKGTMSPGDDGSYWFELNLWCDGEEAGTVNIEYNGDTFLTNTDAYVVSVSDSDEIQAEGNSFADVYDTCVGELIRLAEDYVNFVR